MLLYGGKIQFQQELQLISNLDVMLSMDSGNAHIAAMLSSYALGATHPFAVFYHSTNGTNALVSDRILFPKLPTSVYGNKRWKDVKMQ
jgi:ADP-heptose:LPS heptosyltransferase